MKKNRKKRNVKKYLTVKEVSEMFNIRPQKITYAIRNDGFDVKHDGQKYLIARTLLESINRTHKKELAEVEERVRAELSIEQEKDAQHFWKYQRVVIAACITLILTLILTFHVQYGKAVHDAQESRSCVERKVEEKIALRPIPNSRGK
jgi:hypothetical protein